MQVNCPHNWCTRIPFGNAIMEDYRVNICNGICDSSDLCKIEKCSFFDLSQEATRLYIEGSNFERTFEFLDRKEELLAELHIQVAAEREKFGTERPDDQQGELPSMNVYFPD